MHFSHFTAGVVLFASLATAQDLSTLQNLPECIQKPAETAFVASGCSLNNAKCICTNQAFHDTMTQATLGDCSKDDQLKVLNFVTSFCSAAGVQLNIPQASATQQQQQAATPPPAPTSTPAPTSAPAPQSTSSVYSTSAPYPTGSSVAVYYPTATGSGAYYPSAEAFLGAATPNARLSAGAVAAAGLALAAYLA